MNCNNGQKHEKVVKIGYYPIRGKAQVPRLVCQYLKINYIDQLFELQQWNKFKANQTQGWDFTDLPFLQDQDFILTESFPICCYLIEKHNRKDLLGKTLAHQGIVQMYLWTIESMGSVISINCSKNSQQQKNQFRETQWKTNVLHRLLKYEHYIESDGWFLGYLTLIDFSIYQLIRYINFIFPGKSADLPKLCKIRDMVFELREIKEYEDSLRAITEMDPTALLARLKKGN